MPTQITPAYLDAERTIDLTKNNLHRTNKAELAYYPKHCDIFQVLKTELAPGAPSLALVEKGKTGLKIYASFYLAKPSLKVYKNKPDTPPSRGWAFEVFGWLSPMTKSQLIGCLRCLPQVRHMLITDWWKKALPEGESDQNYLINTYYFYQTRATKAAAAWYRGLGFYGALIEEDFNLGYTDHIHLKARANKDHRHPHLQLMHIGGEWSGVVITPEARKTHLIDPLYEQGNNISNLWIFNFANTTQKKKLKKKGARLCASAPS